MPFNVAYGQKSAEQLQVQLNMDMALSRRKMKAAAPVERGNRRSIVAEHRRIAANFMRNMKRQEEGRYCW